MTDTTTTGISASDLIEELSDIKDRRTELDQRRDQIIKTLMRSKAPVPRAEIAAAAGLREARLYQIAPGGRKPLTPLMVSSPMLPELNDEDIESLPRFEAGDDTELVELIAARINEKSQLMSEWGILAFVRAIRDQFPDRTFDPSDHEQQDAVARCVGYSGGGTRLRMARLVMEGLALHA
jgi:hypothetical protein